LGMLAFVAAAAFGVSASFGISGANSASTALLQIGNQHQTQHRKEKECGVEEHARRSGGTHRIGHLEDTTQQSLCELVGLWISHDEKYERRDERILGLQK
jgi:hypothetical protein